MGGACGGISAVVELPEPRRVCASEPVSSRASAFIFFIFLSARNQYTPTPTASSSTTTLARTTYIHQTQKKQPVPHGTWRASSDLDWSFDEKHAHQSSDLDGAAYTFLVEFTPFGQFVVTASPI